MMEITKEKLAAALRLIRETLKLSQPAMAQRLMVTSQSVYRYESGRPPRSRILLKYWALAQQLQLAEEVRLIAAAIETETGVPPDKPNKTYPEWEAERQVYKEGHPELSGADQRLIDLAAEQLRLGGDSASAVRAALAGSSLGPAEMLAYRSVADFAIQETLPLLAEDTAEPDKSVMRTAVEMLKAGGPKAAMLRKFVDAFHELVLSSARLSLIESSPFEGLTAEERRLSLEFVRLLREGDAAARKQILPFVEGWAKNHPAEGDNVNTEKAAESGGEHKGKRRAGRS